MGVLDQVGDIRLVLLLRHTAVVVHSNGRGLLDLLVGAAVAKRSLGMASAAGSAG
jgi:hypothetical protein